MNSHSVKHSGYFTAWLYQIEEIRKETCDHKLAEFELNFQYVLYKDRKEGIYPCGLDLKCDYPFGSFDVKFYSFHSCCLFVKMNLQTNKPCLCCHMLVRNVPFSDEEGKLPWPIGSDINIRLRRLITGYQRKHKMEQQRQELHAKVCRVGINGVY